MHPRCFHYLIFILMVERILMLALISSRTAVGRIVGIRSGSHVVGRSGTTGHPAGDLCLSLSPWIHRSGSQAVDLLPWIGGEQVILILWESTLQSRLVIISQVGIENPKVLIICRFRVDAAVGIFRGIFFDRVGIVKGISTGLLLYLLVCLLASVQVFLIYWASSVFGTRYISSGAPSIWLGF